MFDITVTNATINFHLVCKTGTRKKKCAFLLQLTESERATLISFRYFHQFFNLCQCAFFIIALFFRFNDKSQPFIDQGWLVSCNINDLEQWNDKEFPSHHCNKINFVCLITENAYACRLRNLVMAIKCIESGKRERVRELLNIERFLLWLNDYGFSAQVHALFTCFIGMRNQSPEIQCLTIEDWVHNDSWKKTLNNEYQENRNKC